MSEPDMIINPSRDSRDPSLPAVGLFLINPAEAQAGFKLAGSRGGENHFLYNSRLSVISENQASNPFFIAGPAVGAPMAVLTLEKLIILGAQRIVVYGWCGSLNNTLRIGDVLLPTWARSSEGTSAHYPLDKLAESHAPTRQALSDLLAAQGTTVQAGPIWTTDAPYRESTTQVKELNEQEILGVDMEYAALIAVAAFRKIELTAAMLVSDELWSGTWNPGFRTKGFKNKSKELLGILMDFCSTLSVAK